MPQPDRTETPSPFKPNPLPVAAPAHRKEDKRAPGVPDLRIEEIEERHIPKDRNVFDK